LILGIRSPMKSVQEFFGHVVVFRHFRAELVLHLDHHGHTRIAGKEIRVAVNESSVKSIPYRATRVRPAGPFVPASSPAPFSTWTKTDGVQWLERRSLIWILIGYPPGTGDLTVALACSSFN